MKIIITKAHTSSFNYGSCQNATNKKTKGKDFITDLFPPRGIYIYLISHALNPLCHILQNPSNP
jgi:hypothetical protein